MAKTIILLLILSTSTLYGQSPFFKNYGVKDGLLTATVFDITQDKNGFIWMGTNEGVTRFDGYSFSSFNTDNGLSDNVIFRVENDNKGRLWFLSQNGHLCYYKNDKLYNEKNDKLLLKLRMQHPIYSFCKTEEGAIFFGDYKGAIRQISENDSVQSYKTNAVLYNLWESKGKVYSLCNRNIIKKLKTGKIINQLPIANSSLFLRSCIYKDTLLVSSGSMIYFVYNNQLLPYTFQLKDRFDEIISMSVTGDELWIGKRKGVLNAKNISALIAGNYNSYLKGASVTSVLKDEEKNYWFSTLNNGVFFTTSLNVINYNEVDPMNVYDIRTVEKDWNGDIWFGNSINYFFILKDGMSYRHNFGSEIELSITNIHHDYNNKLSFIASKAGLGILGWHRDLSYYPSRANDIYIDPNGNHWIGNNSCYVLDSSMFYPMVGGIPYIIANKGKSIINEPTYTFYGKNDSTLLVGTIKGGYEILYSPENVSEYKVSTVYDGKVNDISGEDNLIAIATEDNGLILIDDNRKDTINKVKGLTTNKVNTVLVEDHNSIWLGTLYGIEKITRQKGNWKIENYTDYLGISRFKVNDIELSGDEIYIASNRGLVRFDRKDIKPTCYNPKIYIDNIEVANNAVVYNDTIAVSYLSNNISVHFTGISFRGHEALRYEYMLEGFENKWNTTTARQVKYASLPKGKYTLKVKAISAYGYKSVHPATVTFSVTAPFWKSKWFYFAISIIIILIISIVAWLRLRLISKKHELEKTNISASNIRTSYERDLRDLEQKALRMQMNPHFIFNALNTIKGYYAESRDEEASEYISKFSRLLRLILESDSKLIFLEQEVEILSLYLELTAIRYGNKFNYKIDVHDTLDRAEVTLPPMLIQPILENAIIHGVAPKEGYGQINIKFINDNDKLVCIVEDNGIGRKRSGQNHKVRHYESKATELIKARLETLRKSGAIEGKIEIIDMYEENNTPSGTKVIITMPLTTNW